MIQPDSTIAVIGLGIMGGPIARRLRERFAQVRGHDLDAQACERARAQGVQVPGSVAACVAGADLIFTVLPTLEAGKVVMREIVSSARRGAIWVELGTIGSAAAREQAAVAEAAGLGFVDAPVINGGQQGAEAGTLKILAGGDAQTIARIEPALLAFSTETLCMGPAGSAQTMKLINNMLLAAISSATAEALALAERAGIGAGRAFDILRLSSTRSFALDWLFPAAVQGDFSGGAKIDILVKDMALAEQEAALHQAQVPFADISAALFRQCQARGWGSSDMSIVLKLLAETNATSND